MKQQCHLFLAGRLSLVRHFACKPLVSSRPLAPLIPGRSQQVLGLCRSFVVLTSVLKLNEMRSELPDKAFATKDQQQQFRATCKIGNVIVEVVTVDPENCQDADPGRLGHRIWKELTADSNG